MDQDQLPELLSIRKCIERFGISKSTLRRWQVAKRIEGKKVGRNTYLLTKSIQRAIQELPDV